MTTTVSNHPSYRSGPSNELLGTLCFLAAEGMFFLGLIFVALEVRRNSVAWPPPDAPEINLAVPMLNTLVLLVSSLTMHAAIRAIRRGDKRQLAIRLAATTALGVIFVAGQAYEFIQLGGWRPGEGVYRSLFDTLVGLHAAHVLAGIGLLCVVLFRAVYGQFTSDRHMAVTGAELYWHFVTAAWVVLFAVLMNFNQLPELATNFAGLISGVP